MLKPFLIHRKTGRETLPFMVADGIILEHEEGDEAMHSMTGCGTGTVQAEGWEVTVDLKTVNHRFLDISMRLPRNLSFLEQSIREVLAGGLRRGHIDVFLTVRRTDTAQVRVDFDSDLAVLYTQAAAALAGRTGLTNDLTVSRLMKMEGVLTVSECDMDQEKVSGICSQAAAAAMEQVNTMREKEGVHLKEDLRFHLDCVSAIREKILNRAPSVVTEYRDKLESRIRSMVADGIEPQRIAQEVALAADRCAIDEELARLESHIRQMTEYLEAKGEIGKKMDFLIQEMNREANTIGSKASDGEITQSVVDLKSEIEKLREQIQNVE